MLSYSSSLLTDRAYTFSGLKTVLVWQRPVHSKVHCVTPYWQLANKCSPFLSHLFSRPVMSTLGSWLPLKSLSWNLVSPLLSLPCVIITNISLSRLLISSPFSFSFLLLSLVSYPGLSSTVPGSFTRVFYKPFYSRPSLVTFCCRVITNWLFC